MKISCCCFKEMMIFPAALFICGIAAFSFIPFFPLSISALLMSAFLVCCFFKRRKGRIRMTLKGVFIFALGFIWCFVREQPLPEIMLPDQDLFVEGSVLGVPEILENKVSLTINNVLLEGAPVPGKARLAILPGMFGSPLSGGLFEPGSRIAAVAKLREPCSLRNPGLSVYDLRKDGFVAVGYVKQMRIRSPGGGIWAWISKKRQDLAIIIERSLSPESASFLKAIIPGIRSGISPEMRDAFSATGLAHLLSISGTHFGLLAAMFFLSIRAVFRLVPDLWLARLTLYVTPTQTAALGTLPLLLMYALISGLSTPTVRSFIMVFIYLLSLLLGRRGQWLNSLSIAAVILLIWHPRNLFEPSFLLSFFAVFAIGLLLEKKTAPSNHRNLIRERKERIIKRFLKRTVSKLKTALMITAAAISGTAPVVAIFFKQFSLVSPLANLTVTPLVCFFVLPLGFFAGFSALILNMPVMPFSGAIDNVIYSVLRMTKLSSGIPWASIPVHNPTAAEIIMYYPALFLLVRSRRRWRILPLVIVLCSYFILPSPAKGDLMATFLDVGQGDASVVELPDGKVMLIDGGTGDPDMGRRVIAPYLWSRGIKSIDYLIISHSHPDHYGGLDYVMENFAVQEIWFNGRMTEGGAVFFQRAGERGIVLRALKRGDVLERDRYRVLVLHPYDEFYARSPRGEFSRENSDSLVFRLESDGISILYTGDIEKEAEEDLIHLGTMLKSDVIKVPHHGGRTSSSREFIRTVGPETAIASAGRNNPFRHPHLQTLERYRSAGTRLLRTDAHGAITISGRKGRHAIQTYADSQLKKVKHWRDEKRNLMLLL